MIFFLLSSFAALFSCNDTEALDKRTDERKLFEKYIKAELMLDTSDHLLMQTDLIGLDYDYLAGRGKRSSWIWRSGRGQNIPRSHYRNMAGRGGSYRRCPFLENKAASVQVHFYLSAYLHPPTALSLVLVSRMTKYTRVCSQL